MYVVCCCLLFVVVYCCLLLLVFKEGDAGTSWYIILRGSVNVLVGKVCLPLAVLVHYTLYMYISLSLLGCHVHSS